MLSILPPRGTQIYPILRGAQPYECLLNFTQCVPHVLKQNSSSSNEWLKVRKATCHAIYHHIYEKKWSFYAVLRRLQNEFEAGCRTVDVLYKKKINGQHAARNTRSYTNSKRQPSYAKNRYWLHQKRFRLDPRKMYSADYKDYIVDKPGDIDIAHALNILISWLYKNQGGVDGTISTR